MELFIRLVGSTMSAFTRWKNLLKIPSFRHHVSFSSKLIYCYLNLINLTQRERDGWKSEKSCDTIKVGILNIWETFYFPHPKHDSSFYNLIYSVNFRRQSGDAAEKCEGKRWQKKFKRQSITSFLKRRVDYISHQRSVTFGAVMDDSCNTPNTTQRYLQTWFHTKCLDKRWYFISHLFGSLFKVESKIRECSIMIWIYVRFSIPHMWITKFIVLWDDFMDNFVITGWRDWVERWRNLSVKLMFFWEETTNSRKCLRTVIERLKLETDNFITGFSFN